MAPDIIKTIDLPPDWSAGRSLEDGQIIARKGDTEIYSFMLTGHQRADRAIIAVAWPEGHWARCVSFGGGIVGTDQHGDLTADAREAILYATPILHRWAVGLDAPAPFSEGGKA